MSCQDFIHDIFVVDPVKQAELVRSNAKIVLTNGETLDGTIYTVDPVSQCVVLTTTKKDSEKKCVRIVMKHSIKSMETFPEISSSELNISHNQCFTIEKVNPVIEHSKEEVKEWLEKHMIPVVENEGVLKIDNLEIHPTYGPDQCFSSNSIVLSRIQNLLSQMPKKSESKEN